ncbi:MAG: S41 family peptidase [Bacteroidia bacterium]
MNKRSILRISMMLVLIGSLGFITQTAGDLFEISKNLEIFGKLYTEVNKVYVDETNPTALMRTGIDAMLASLDPYTNFYSESQIDLSRLINSGQYSSIGVEVGRRGGQVVIVEVEGGGPADAGGLLVGDAVLEVDNLVLTGSGQTLEEVRNLLMGQKGTPVRLLIQRADEPEPRSFLIERGGVTVEEENVPYAGLIQPEIGYIQLTGFMANAGQEVATALKRCQEQSPGLRGVILDLRGNPGGRLDQAVAVSNVFIGQGELITEMRGRTTDSRSKFYTMLPPVDAQIPLVVLINGRSASASEIVSGSIQDLDRGVIVGRRSFGKGLVQNVRPLESYNTQMKITIAKYYTPSGRCIQALDYAHRQPDGSVGRIPDSLIQAFKTKNGRLVYDGGGVDPDIEVVKPAPQPISQALKDQNLIFDFATRYVAAHDSIAPARTFAIDDATFEAFVAFVRERGFAFRTVTEQQLDALADQLAREGYDDDSESTFAELRRKIEMQKEADLYHHRDEIADLLRTEIVGRYYFRAGLVEAAFDTDPDLLRAIEVLRDPVQYKALLSKQP